MRGTLAILGALSALAAAAHADWRQFRGNDTTGIDAAARVTADWANADLVQWKADLPGRGLSSPIVIGDRIVLTACSGYHQDTLHVLCFHADDGRLLWQREFRATGRTMSHPKTCVAAPTPASDGERIFASFSSNDVACLDLDGHLLWYRGLTADYPGASNSLGMSSSLLVADETLIAMMENDADSFTVGLDVLTGRERWKIDRPRRANWTSPSLWRGADGEQLVLLQSSAGVAAVKPGTGDVAWSYNDGASTIPSLTVAEGFAVVPSHGLTAIRPGRSTPDVAEIVWQESSLAPNTSSPLVHDGSVYVIVRPNVLVQADAATGKVRKRLRLSGNFSSTPVVAGDTLFVFSEEGTGHVVDIAGDPALVATREFEDVFLGTPAISGNALFVRSDAHLWKLAAE